MKRAKGAGEKGCGVREGDEGAARGAERQGRMDLDIAESVGWHAERAASSTTPEQRQEGVVVVLGPARGREEVGLMRQVEPNL